MCVPADLRSMSSQTNRTAAVRVWEAEAVFSTRRIRLWSQLLVQAVPAEGPRWSAMRSAPPGAGVLHLQLFSLMLMCKTAVFLSGISRIVVLSSEKCEVLGLWAAHPVHMKAKTCGQER